MACPVQALAVVRRVRSVRYPPPNGETLTMEIVQGQESCEVVYDDTSAPSVRATSGTCGAAVCIVRATYSSPCRAQDVVATARVWAVEVECLQVLTFSSASGFDESRSRKSTIEMPVVSVQGHRP